MRDAERTLWEELKALVRTVAAIFGDPVSLYEERVLPRGEALALKGWLRALEAAARALLLVLAARLPQPEPQPAQTKTLRPTAKAAPAAAGAADPAMDTPPSERWAEVVFRAVPTASGSSGPRAPLARFVSSRSLAYRLEALIRVAEAPDVYALRLARRLRASPALALRVLKPPPAHGGRRPPWGDLPEEARALALAPATLDSG